MCFYTVRVAQKFEPLSLRCFKAARCVAKITPSAALLDETVQETVSSVQTSTEEKTKITFKWL